MQVTYLRGLLSVDESQMIVARLRGRTVADLAKARGVDEKKYRHISAVALNKFLIAFRERLLHSEWRPELRYKLEVQVEKLPRRDASFADLLPHVELRATMLDVLLAYVAAETPQSEEVA